MDFLSKLSELAGKATARLTANNEYEMDISGLDPSPVGKKAASATPSPVVTKEAAAATPSAVVTKEAAAATPSPVVTKEAAAATPTPVTEEAAAAIPAGETDQSTNSVLDNSPPAAAAAASANPVSPATEGKPIEATSYCKRLPPPPLPMLAKQHTSRTAMLAVAGLEEYYSVLVHDLQVDSKQALLKLKIEHFDEAVKAAKLTLPYRKRLLFLGLQQDIRLTSEMAVASPMGGDCAVCFSTEEECELLVLKCNQTICRSCFRTELATHISNGERPRCPFFDECQRTLTPDEVDEVFGDTCPLCFLPDPSDDSAAAAVADSDRAKAAMAATQLAVREDLDRAHMVQIPCVFDHRFCLRCLRKHAEHCLQRKEIPSCPRHKECRHFLQPAFLEREIFVIDEDAFALCPFTRGYVKPSVFNAHMCPDVVGYVRKSIFNGRCRNCNKFWKAHSPNIFHTRCQTCMRPLRDHTPEKVTVEMITTNTRLLKAYHDLRLQHTANEHRFMKECGNPNCKEMVTLPFRSILQVRQAQSVCPCVCDACHATWCSRCWQPYHYNTTCEGAAAHTSVWFGFLQSQGNVGARTKEAFRNYEALRADEALKAKNCRLCPHCGLIVWRTDGCNQVTCGADASDKGGKVHFSKGCQRKFDWSKAESYKPRVQFHAPSCESGIIRKHGEHFPRMLCSCCSVLITGTYFSCIHCRRGTTTPAAAVRRSLPRSPHRQPKNKWACPACTFLNSKAVSKCEICRAARPAAPPRPPRSTSLQDGTDDGVSLCRTCMFTLVAGNDARPNQRPDVLGRHGGHVFRIVQPLTPDQIKKLKQSKKSKKKKNFFQRFFGTKY